MNREWHPELWTEAERDRWLSDRLRRWAAWWRQHQDYLDLLRRQDQRWRERLRNEVGEFLRTRRKRLYRPLYRACDCGCREQAEHLRDALGYPRWPRPLDHTVTDEELTLYVAENPAERAFLASRLLAALVTIERSNPQGPIGQRWQERHGHALGA